MMRVQKYLSRAGYCSRREGERLMELGRVHVNGEVCRELGSKVDPDEDVVEVDGRRVELPEEFTYLLLNKPEGYVTTLDDPQGRKTVADLVPEEAGRLWPVGRLDRDSSGLLLMTDDGIMTHRLTHPSFEARKHYRVRVDGRPDASQMDRLREGVRLEDGYVTEPADVEVVERSEESTVLEITLTEGKNRQIRRMADTVGHSVQSLHRNGVGPIAIGDLEPGATRELEEAEVDALYEEVDLDPSERGSPESADHG